MPDGRLHFGTRVNTPAFLAMLPPIAGLRGLDIGCGEGGNTRGLARRGASMAASDMSPTFLRHAHEAEASEPLGIEYVHADAACPPSASETFDFRDRLHVADGHAGSSGSLGQSPPGAAARRLPVVLHPAPVLRATASARVARGGWARRCAQSRWAACFDNIDGRVDRWCGAVSKEERARVPPFQEPRFHRTLSAWINLVVASGFVLEQLGETYADEATAAAVPAVADTRVAPLFLHVRGRKPAIEASRR